MQGRKIVEQDWMDAADYDATIRNLAMHSPRPVKVTFNLGIKTAFMTVERMDKLMQALSGMDETETQVKVRITATFEDSMQMRLFPPEERQGEFNPEQFLGHGVTEVVLNGEEYENGLTEGDEEGEEDNSFYEVNDPVHETTKAVLHAVGDYYDMTQEAILGPSRLAPIVKARHVAMYLLSADAKYSYSEIGRLLERDPASVTHAVSKITGELDEESGDTGTRVDVRKIRDALGEYLVDAGLGQDVDNVGTTGDSLGIEGSEATAE